MNVLKRYGCFPLGSDQNFCSVRLGKNLAELFCLSISCSLTIYGYKVGRLCNSLQQIVFSVTAKFHNTYHDNSVLRCKIFGLLRGRILYSCFDFIVLAQLYMLRLRFFETWHFMFLIFSNRAIAAIVLSAHHWYNQSHRLIHFLFMLNRVLNWSMVKSCFETTFCQKVVLKPSFQNVRKNYHESEIIRILVLSNRAIAAIALSAIIN